MDEYLCNGCNYSYGPDKGDAKSSIPPGTSFESLPEDWRCPQCGASKLGFTRMADAKSAKDKKSAIHDDPRYINADQIGWKSTINR